MRREQQTEAGRWRSSGVLCQRDSVSLPLCGAHDLQGDAALSGPVSALSSPLGGAHTSGTGLL